MGCFCKSTIPQLQGAMNQLAAPAGASLPGIRPVAALSAWLGARGLPSEPWSPDPAWAQARLPVPPLSPASMATIGALATLRAQALSQFGIDLLQPSQAAMFARVSATLAARVATASAAAEPAPALPTEASSTAAANAAGSKQEANGPGWVQLASDNFAIDQVSQAIKFGVFAADPQAYAVTAPMQDFTTRLSATAPLVAVSAQLGIDTTGDFAPTLATAIRALLAVPLPMPAAPALAGMARLSAQLSAVASLKSSLGTDPLQAGLPATRQAVAAKLAALQPALAEVGLVSSPASGGAGPETLAALPALPYCPASLATPAVVRAALSMNQASVAALTWHAPPIASVAQLKAGLPVVSLAAQMKAALGISAATSPCASGCDGGAVLRAAMDA